MSKNLSEIFVEPSDTNQHGFGTVNYLVIAIMLSISTGIGIYFGCFGNKIKTADEYLLGGRKMKTIPIAISLIASQLSGISIMSIPAEIYTFGTQFSLIIPSMLITTSVVNFIFIPIFYKNQITNCYEYLEIRFSTAVRKLVTFTYIFGVLTFQPIMMFIPSLAFSQVTGVNVHIINTIIACVVTFYTMLGGIKAVVWTDVVQGMTMLISSIAVLAIAIYKIGGIGEVIRLATEGNRLEFFNMSLDLTTRHTFWNTVLGYSFQWTAYVGLNQSCVQRIVSVPTIHHAKRALWIFGVGLMLINFLCCSTGVAMFAHYAACDPIKSGIVEKADKMMPYFIQDVVGHIPGMPGVFIACVFSASLSTLSANMNSFSGILYEDFIRKFKVFKHTEERGNLTMKIITIFLGVYFAAMGLFVVKFNYLFQLVVSLTGIIMGATLGIFLLGVMWPYANKYGGLYGTLASFLITGFIVLKQQYLILMGEINAKPLPTSIENCDSFEVNTTAALGNFIGNQVSLLEQDDSFSIFKISFPWFNVIGVLIVFLVGVPVSYFTGGQDLKLIGSRLVSPLVHRLLPKDMLEYELDEHQQKNDHFATDDRNIGDQSKPVVRNL